MRRGCFYLYSRDRSGLLSYSFSFLVSLAIYQDNDRMCLSNFTGLFSKDCI